MRIDPHESNEEVDRTRHGPAVKLHEMAAPVNTLGIAADAYALVLSYSIHYRALRRIAAIQKTATRMSPSGDDDCPVKIAATAA